MLPGGAGNVDSDALDLRIASKKKLGQLQGEIFDTLGRALAGARIDRVLHRVRGQDRAVIAGGEAAFEVAGEQHFDFPFPHGMQRTVALHLHHAHARFSVRILCQGNHRLAPPVGGIAIRTQKQWNVQVGIAGPHGHDDLNREVQPLDRSAPRDRSRSQSAAGIVRAAKPDLHSAAEGWRSGHRRPSRSAPSFSHSPDGPAYSRCTTMPAAGLPSAVSSTWVEMRLTQPPSASHLRSRSCMICCCCAADSSNSCAGSLLRRRSSMLQHFRRLFPAGADDKDPSKALFVLAVTLLHPQ